MCSRYELFVFVFVFFFHFFNPAIVKWLDYSSVLFVQACKVEDLGKMEFDEAIKKRFKMVYVPNWFSVVVNTGGDQVSFSSLLF